MCAKLSPLVNFCSFDEEQISDLFVKFIKS